MPDSRAARIRARLPHPIIDGDGHWLEPVPVFLDYLRETGGPRLADEYMAGRRKPNAWYDASPEERQRKRMPRRLWWGVPSRTIDRATAMLPGLLHDRLPELGIDFAVVYPSMCLPLTSLPREDLRLAAVRAYNRMTSELFAPYRDRLAPVAILPAHTPQEGLEEARFAVDELGFKAAMIRGSLPRVDGDGLKFVDTLGLDSPYDYAPLWQAFLDLGLAVTVHGGSLDWPDRTSMNNYVFNHVGHFANANHAFCRSVFLGGVVRRFPRLNFAFLEGGVGWARQLLCDLIGHWQKRNPEALRRFTRPDVLDQLQLRELIAEYGGDSLRAAADGLLANVDAFNPELTVDDLLARDPEAVDDFGAAGIDSEVALAEHFSRRFYFGCEADDPMTVCAFDRRLGVRLKPVFSSDISHFDVPDMTKVVPEAFEMVERGHLDETDFREFTFANAVRLHAGMNPDFFAGTTVEREAGQQLAPD